MWVSEQSASISPEFMPMTEPLAHLINNVLMASPRRMYWLLLALKRCSKIKIIKSSDNRLCRNGMLLLNTAWTGCIEKRYFLWRTLCEGCLLLGVSQHLRQRRCWYNICHISRMATSLQMKAGSAGKLRDTLWRIPAPTLWTSNPPSSSSHKVPLRSREDK